MAVKNVLIDNREIAISFPDVTAATRGDFIIDNSGVAQLASAMADQGTLVLNQARFARLFMGIALNTRLVGETPAANRVISAMAIADVNCASATWVLGDLIGGVEDAGGTYIENQKCVKVTQPMLAIGVCIQPGTSVTVVRGAFFSRRVWDFAHRAATTIGQGQGVASSLLTDAAQTLTITTNPILYMVPTAARSVTLPDEAAAAAAGIMFRFTNNSAGANTVTFLGSAGGAIKGNGATPQNKSCILWSDGTNWNGNVSA